jgi:hypothetical protein
MEKEPMVKVQIRLTKNDMAIVQELAGMDGEGFNAALRKIIREWARVNPNGKVIVTGGQPVEK